MNRPPKAAVYSHQRWRLGTGRTSRWQIGFDAPRDTDGALTLTRTAVQALVAAQDRLRSQSIAGRLAAGADYVTALLGTDAALERIHLDGPHLVFDWRHVYTETDAVISIEPDSSGLYRVPSPQGAWIQTRPGTCDLVVAPDGPPQFAVVHSRCSDDRCTVTVFATGERVPDRDVHVFDIDPGRGHDLGPDGLPGSYTEDLAAAEGLGPQVHAAVNDAYTDADWQRWA